jgi:hypothetical protein
MITFYIQSFQSNETAVDIHHFMYYKTVYISLAHRPEAEQTKDVKGLPFSKAVLNNFVYLGLATLQRDDSHSVYSE